MAPAQFYEQPDINPQWSFYWQAFHDLSSERQIGMAIGPIPRSAIKNYADEFSIVGDRFDSFERIIRSVDAEYLKLAQPKKPDEKGTSAGVEDLAGVKDVMARLGARASAAKGRRKH